MISGILVPPAIVTTIRLLRAMGLYGSETGLVFFYCGWLMAIAIFLITGFVKTIPLELEEAARIDGASALVIFRRIIFPILRPITIAAGFIMLLVMWNDFLYPFFFLNGSNNQTLTLGLYNFVSASLYEVKWNLVFADVVVTSLPLVAVYYVCQRWVVAGFMGVAGGK
jgi:raffinose/stachyose/melibiose transport system permease protein